VYLLFWDEADIAEPFGKIVFGAEPLRADREAVGFPDMQYGCEAPRDDGSTWVYGWRMANWADCPHRTLEVIRCVTADGLHFTGAETVGAWTNKDWQGFANIVRRPTDGALFLFPWSAGVLQVFRSMDGRQWQQLTDHAYTGHDAMCIFWYPPLGEFVNMQNTLQPYPKRYPDNIGAYRRVASFRRSKDGVQWTSFSPAFLGGADLWTPDADDPADLEFYRSIVFPLQGRYAMLLQDYLPPPPEANSRRATTKHGPRSHVEWAISRDGLNWKRPYRQTDATELVGGLPVQGPMVRGGLVRFYSPGGSVAALPEDRIFYVTCRANGEFTTPPVVMPATGLCLNANVLYRPNEGTTGRAYVMVELRDENGVVIPGYERGKCLLANQDGRALPLVWGDAGGSALAGRAVRLRIYLRDAKIYGLTAVAKSTGDGASLIPQRVPSSDLAQGSVLAPTPSSHSRATASRKPGSR
jgi:hypothetical protein